jgi:signal transduction histidine kinase
VAAQTHLRAEEAAVLVLSPSALAPSGADAELLTRALTDFQIHWRPIASVRALTQPQVDAASALLIAEEALTPEVVADLRDLLESQPAWSDIPLLVLVAGGGDTLESRQRERERLALPQATLLERPLRAATLLANIRFAQRAREKQFEMKHSMAQRQLAEDALRKSEKLAVAGRLAASIAHEINNPLESVTNLLYLIRNSTTLEDAKQFCALAETELRRVSEIATQTLRFYRQQSEATRLDVTQITDSVLSLYQGRLHSHQVQVICDYRTHSELLCYAGELRQLIANLISNALDAMKQTGTLTLRLREALDLEGREGIRITIADTGTGIPPDLRKRIFEPFVTTKGATGTGLGLWVTAEILRKHAGRMTFRSSTRPGHSGTVFTIFLPFCEVLPAQSPAAEPRSGHAQGAASAAA